MNFFIRSGDADDQQQLVEEIHNITGEYPQSDVTTVHDLLQYDRVFFILLPIPIHDIVEIAYEIYQEEPNLTGFELSRGERGLVFYGTAGYYDADNIQNILNRFANQLHFEFRPTLTVGVLN